MATLDQSADSFEKPLTIGAVRDRLKQEFPDISISKIRYLEEQGLIAPRRTPGGYRLFSETDYERLRTILQLQRDEFLPLRVIRQELAAPGGRSSTRSSSSSGLRSTESHVDFETLCERSGVDPRFLRELEEYGLLEPHYDNGVARYSEKEVDVAAACARLAQYGAEPRNLRSLRTGADREVSLLEQMVAPALHSQNPERREEGIEDLEVLASLSRELSQLLFWRALRGLVTR